MRKLLGCTLIVLGAALPAGAQMDHPGHGMASSDLPHAQDWADINARMHEAMNVPPSGDADVDFIRSMIPHHQGAVEMAEYVLENGKDPEVRALAESVIAAQNEEIEMMEAWLKAMGVE